MMKIWNNKTQQKPSLRGNIQNSYKRMFAKSAHSEHRESVASYFKGNKNEFYRSKPNTHSGSRFNQTYYSKHFQNMKNLATSVDKSTHAHSVSFDATSKRRNKDLGSEEFIIKNEKETQSPRSILNSIIDQWYKLDEETNQNFESDFTHNESMFEFSQQMVEKYNPSVYRTLDQMDKNTNIQSQKSWLRPSTISK